MSRIQRIRGLLLFAIASLIGKLNAAELVLSGETGLRLDRGFQIELVSEDAIAPDISAMTLDGLGRPWVAGPGYIRRLEDRNKDGRFEHAETLARPRGSAMGLAFDGQDLLAVVDAGLWRYRNLALDGPPEGMPERLMALQLGEHGSHAIRKGPDGAWYLLGGNDAGFSTLLALERHSWIRKPVAGGLIKLGTNFKEITVEAHGFRNPYDFDFTENGSVVTWDSDCERDFALPWYVPTRVYTMAMGQHHGWQLGGHLRTWARPSYDEDSVAPAHWMGRASPTGVVNYRHRLFPEHYQGGMFVLDWTFGKVWFCPATGTAAELFIEPAGANGFAPTDAVIEPEGSMLLSIGGRRTRGGVYRIRPVATTAIHQPKELQESMDAILNAPQPLDAWSRRRWEPVASQLGAEQLAKAARDSVRSPSERIRAIEILADPFGARDEATFSAVGRDLDAPPRVRARAIWALGLSNDSNAANTLLQALADPSAEVRRTACESLARRLGMGMAVERQELMKRMPALLNDVRHVRRAARLVALQTSDSDWASIVQLGTNSTPSVRLGLAWASVERGNLNSSEVIEVALACLAHKPSRADHGRALRLIVRAWSDWKLDKPSVELFTGFELAEGIPPDTNKVERAKQAVLAVLESAPPHHDVAREAARLLAMLEDHREGTVRAVLARLRTDSAPADDFHFLTVLARLKGPWGADVPQRVVEALLGMDRKLQGASRRPKQVWSLRLQELNAALIKAHPEMVELLLKHPDFPKPAHVDLVRGAFARIRDARIAAGLFFEAVKRDDSFPWTPPLVEMISLLPPSESFQFLRGRVKDPIVGKDVFRVLAIRPHEEDRQLFLDHLGSSDSGIVRLALNALGRCSASSTPTTLLPLIKVLKRSTTDPSLKAFSTKIAEELQRQSQNAFKWNSGVGVVDLSSAQYQSALDWFSKSFPVEANQLNASEAEPATPWRSLVEKVDWAGGDVAKGRRHFQERACAGCHDSMAAVGPSLAGATQRLSREALLESLFEPDRSVSPAYQTSWIKPRGGEPILGQVVFESADGVIVMEGPGKTSRIAEENIESRVPSPRSLMPSGLLENLNHNDLTDLIAYLRSLSP